MMPEPTKGAQGSWLGRLLTPSTPQPTKREDLVADKIYDTPKMGKLKWTGTGFVKPDQSAP